MVGIYAIYGLGLASPYRIVGVLVDDAVEWWGTRVWMASVDCPDPELWRGMQRGGWREIAGSGGWRMDTQVRSGKRGEGDLSEHGMGSDADEGMRGEESWDGNVGC